MTIIAQWRSTHFLSDESGSSAVSWISLTASCLAMLLASMSLISGGVGTLAGDTRDSLSALDPEVGVQPGGPAAQASPDVQPN